MGTEPDPATGDRDAPPERREADDATRYPGHEDPDTLRERAGLDDRERETRGAPSPEVGDPGA